MSKRKLPSSVAAVASSSHASSKTRKVLDLEEASSSSSSRAYQYQDVTFLLKSEPGEFSLDTLRSCERGTSVWDGIRNMQARKHIRQMKCGDLAYFYYSSHQKKTGIHGLVRVVSDAYFPDLSAMNPKHKYFDPKCKDPAKWSSVNIEFVHQLDIPVLLSDLKTDTALSDMALFKVHIPESLIPIYIFLYLSLSFYPYPYLCPYPYS
jgi:predicted RNA-binding protein with PUA-like domain